MSLIEDFVPIVQLIPADKIDGDHTELFYQGQPAYMTFRDSVFLGPWDGVNPQRNDYPENGDTTDSDCVNS